MTLMKLTTWNVNGIRARHGEVLTWLERESPDVLCLQELKASPEDIPPSLREVPAYTCYWHGQKGYSGVSLHVRQTLSPFAPRFGHPAFDHESRAVVAQLGDLLVASVYVPNGGKDFPAKLRFLEKLGDYVGDVHRAGLRLILCGDLNVTRTDQDVHPAERKREAMGQRADERALLQRLFDQGLVDVGRAVDPDNDRLFTWWAPWRSMRERNIGWRLDYVLASESLANTVVRCVALREVGTSDHGPVVAEFAPVTLRDAAPFEREAGPRDRQGQLGLFS